MRYATLIILFLMWCSIGITAQKDYTQYNTNTGTKDLCVGIRNESGTVKNTRCKDIRVPDGYLLDEDEYFLLSTSSGSGGGTSLTTSQTSISRGFSIARKAINSLDDPSFTNGTLQDGRAGEIVTVLITEVSGDGTWSLVPDTKTGFSSIEFDAIDDMATLLYVNDTIGWIVIADRSTAKIQQSATKLNSVTVTAVTHTVLEKHSVVYCDASLNAVTINLPPANGREGQVHNIKKIDSTANICTVDGDGAETIDKSATFVLTSQYEVITIQSDGSEWWIL